MNNLIRVSLTALALATLTTATATEKTSNDSLPSVLDEVVVTGTNANVNRNLIPYTVSVVNERQLDNSGSTELLNVLSLRVPSLFVTQKGVLGYTSGSNGGSGAITLRGVGSSGVLMMVDGQPQFAGIYSHSIADFYSKEYVDHVEVLRGPGSVLYGSNAMGGVINVITKSATADGVHGWLESQYGSYNTWQTTLGGTARYGRFSAMATVSYDRTDGSIDGMDFKQWSGYAKTALQMSTAWKAALDFTLENQRSHDPVYATLRTPPASQIYYQNVTRGEVSASAANRYANTDGNVKFYYSWGNHFIDDPTHFHSVDDRLGILAYQNFKPWQGAAATVGFDFARYGGRVPMSGGQTAEQAPLMTLEQKRITEYSPYVSLSQTLAHSKLIVQAGLRMANSDKFNTQWVPQAGVVYKPVNMLTLKASASMGYRNPSFRELYMYPPHNPDLQPERMWTYEVSAAFNVSRYLMFDLTGYFSQGSNIIQTVNRHNENTGSFRNKGIELSAHSHVLDNLSLNATYSYMHTSLSNLMGAPRHQYFVGADWRIVKPVTLSAQLKGASRLFVGDGAPLQSYATLDIKAAWQTTRWLNLFVRLDNITDARYCINRGYTMPGFTAFGGFKLSI